MTTKDFRMLGGDAPLRRDIGVIIDEPKEDEKTGKVLSIEAWRDGDCGWTWNQWWHVGNYPVSILDATTRAQLKWFRDNGFLSDKSKGKVAIEDDQYNIVVVQKNTREPLFALEYGNLY